jgi:hypothetical protein
VGIQLETFKTWKPITFGIAIWLPVLILIVVFIIGDTKLVNMIGERLLIGGLIVLFLFGFLFSRIAGISRGIVLLSKEGVIWQDKTGTEQPLINLFEVKTWKRTPSHYGRFVPILSFKYPVIFRFKKNTGEVTSFTFVFTSIEDVSVFIETIDSLMEDISKKQSSLDESDICIRQPSWQETRWRPVVGVATLSIGILIFGVPAYYYFVLNEGIEFLWIVFGIITMLNGFRIIRE